ncbi:MAG: phosphocholine cytidylyltransferase family protein, partial [Myxococcales bacterium]|nr:phosphocholine cytidylyltransferase family protein [Myxococcales bacterium]
AGRGSRLMPYTSDKPKCFTELSGQRIVDWVMQAMEEGGAPVSVFIGGYRIDDIKASFPDLTFCENGDWPNNNILFSLMCARDHFGDGFVSSYSDIVFDNAYVQGVVEHPGEIVIGVDTAWRTRYLERSEHPESDAEKVKLGADGTVLSLDRGLESEEADGEFVGVVKFSAPAAQALCEVFDELRDELGDEAPFRNAAHFRKAYLIDMIQELIDRGHTVHSAKVPGRYFEIDTTQDYELAARDWPGSDPEE